MSMTRLLAAASVAALFAASPALADVSAVTLSSGGLAEVTSEHQVAGDGDIRISVPADQVDDVLKSLVVRDAKGKVGAISLDGPTQAQETFRQLPFTPEDLASPTRLLGALQGVDVSVETDGRTIVGKALGVSDRNAGDAGVEKIAAVLDENGSIQSIVVKDGSIIRVIDPAMRQRISTAAEVSGRARASGARQVEIQVTGGGARTVGVSYVVAAPVWKTAYRIVDNGDGKGRLQAWAVIENATGEDWKDVAVTLSSGAPVTLRQRLGQRFWRERPEVPVDVEGARVPDTDPGAIAAKSAGRQATLQRSLQALAAPPAAPRAAMAESMGAVAGYDATIAPVSEADTQAEAVESAIAATYRLPDKISLAAGRTLSTPIVDAEVEMERVALFKSGSGDKPVAALTVKNATEASLPPGIVTVYDAKTGYVGDARLPSMPAGDVRMASFATDRKVSVTSDSTPQETLAGVVVRDGIARVSLKSREATTYTIKGAPDGDRTVLIEHPKREGWTFTSEALSSETPSDHRLKVKVSAGAVVKVKAIQELTRLEAIELAEADDTMLSQWSTSVTDPTLAKKLEVVAKARAQEASFERQIADRDEAVERVKSEQERVRTNLGSVPQNSELGRRYLRQMQESEDKIADTLKQRDGLETQRLTAQAAVEEAMRAF